MARNVIEVILKARDQLTGDLEKVGKTVKKVNTDLVAAGATFGAISGGITLAMRNMVKETVQFGDLMAKTSVRTGISAETLSQLYFVAERTGTAFPRLTMGLKQLGQAAYDASYGMETYTRAFDDLGISVTDQDGNLKNMKDLLFEVADAIKKTENPTKAVALAQKLLGRSGMELIPILKEGSDGFKRLLAEAEALGFSMSEEQARAWEAYMDRLTDFQASMRGLKMQLAAAILPALSAVTTAITKGIASVSGFMREHKVLAQVIMYAVGAIAGSAGLLAAITAIIAIKVPLAAAFSIMFGPIGLITMAIIGVTIAAIKFRREIAEAFLKAADVVLGAVQSMLEGIGWLLDKLGVDWLDGAVEGLERARGKLKEWDDEIDVAQAKAKEAAETIEGDLEPALNGVGEAGEKAAGFWSEVTKAIEELADKEKADKIQETAKRMWEGVRPENLTGTKEKPWETTGGTVGPKRSFYEMDLSGGEVVEKGMERWDEFFHHVGQAQAELSDAFSGTWSNMSNTVGRAFSQMIFAGENMATALKAAFADFAAQAVAEISKVIAKMLVLFTLRKVFGLPFSEGGEVPKTYQHGGLVTGPGGTDKVPAYLTAGELVIPKQLVDFMRSALNAPGPAVVGAGAGGGQHTHWHISALDTATLRHSVRRGALAREMDKARGY